MKEIIIQFDYLHGPLWKDRLDIMTGQWSTGIKRIDNDTTIQSLNDEAEQLYESLYTFEKGSGVQFNEMWFTEIKHRLMEIVQTIISRLSEINDGTFIIVDKTTDMLR